MLNGTECFDPLFFATTEAYDFLTKQDYYLMGGEFSLKRFNDALPYLIKYQNESPYCRNALVFIEHCKNYFSAVEAAKQTIKSKRKEITSRYDTIFQFLGERDGFSCRHCTASINLQIDHIRPLTKGGCNDFSNLQILCGPCNLLKSDKWEGVWKENQ